MFSELIGTLSKFESLTDLHILHPYAALPTPIHYSRSPDLRVAVRRLHENEETEALARELLSALPGLYRVGMGRNSVWERQTRWKEYDADGFLVQRLHKARVPSFYDAGSSLPLISQGEGDRQPAIGDVLLLLKELWVPNTSPTRTGTDQLHLQVMRVLYIRFATPRSCSHQYMSSQCSMSIRMAATHFPFSAGQ